MTDAEEMQQLLTYANLAKVAAALRVSRNAVSQWARGNDVTPYRVRQVRDLLRPTPADAGPISRAEIEMLYRELLGEVRMNRAVVQAVFTGADRAWIQQAMERVAAELSPPARPPAAAPSEASEATKRRRRAAARS